MTIANVGNASTEAKPNNVQSDEQIHPLAQKLIRPIRNWHEWLKMWESTTTHEVLLSLLHTGFEINLCRWNQEPEYTESDRYIFYLKIADNWLNPDRLYKIPKDSSTTNIFDERQKRKEIATKAFEMLCIHLFKIPGPQFEREHICSTVLSEKLLPHIIYFFRPQPDVSTEEWVRLENLPPTYICEATLQKSHREKTAEYFLLTLATHLWKLKPEQLQNYSLKNIDRVKLKNETMMRRVSHAKSWMVDVLHSLDKIDILRQWFKTFDEATVTKLTEVALRTSLKKDQHPVRQSRKVNSIDEACFAGSRAACILKEYTLYISQFERLEKVTESEKVLEQAKKELNRLSS